jgi:hypothetical protein
MYIPFHNDLLYNLMKQLKMGPDKGMILLSYTE